MIPELTDWMRKQWLSKLPVVKIIDIKLQETACYHNKYKRNIVIFKMQVEYADHREAYPREFAG